MTQMRVINTPTLTLEPQTVAHAEEMFAVLCDPAIYEYENEPPLSTEWLRVRFAKLESRQSADGQEQWLNWVIRLPTSELIGFVQATVRPNGNAGIAYVLASAFWGRGLAKTSVVAMIHELVTQYQVTKLTAELKRENMRSSKLLECLGFSLASTSEHAEFHVADDEMLMQRYLVCDPSTGAPISS